MLWAQAGLAMSKQNEANSKNVARSFIVSNLLFGMVLDGACREFPTKMLATVSPKISVLTW
jgi:hypothetical protein